MPLVSIIIAAYNEEKYIKNCIDSLLKQTYEPLELIVIDDGSSDGTKGITRTFNVHLWELNHQGTAIARNFGVSKARGEIIVFLDADMEFTPDFITKLTDPIRQGKTKGTFSKLEYVKNWDKPLARCWNWNNPIPLPDRLRIPLDQETGDDFRAILKSEFMKVKGFDNTGYTDTWTLGKKLGYKPVNAPDAVYYHRNPETYGEIFNAAQWIGKREYKLGKLGSLINILRVCILLSPFKGLIKALNRKEWMFIPFQLVYDLGITFGAVGKIAWNKVIK